MCTKHWALFSPLGQMLPGMLSEKTDLLFQGLPAHLKVRFAANRPTTVNHFIDRMRDVSRELQYAQQALAFQQSDLRNANSNDLCSAYLQPVDGWRREWLAAEIDNANGTTRSWATGGVSDRTSVDA